MAEYVGVTHISWETRQGVIKKEKETGKKTKRVLSPRGEWMA